jgi:hypothetical protein
MKFCMDVELTICHNFCIGYFDQRSTILKRKKEIQLELEFFIETRFEYIWIWSKIKITTWLALDYIEFDSGTLQNNPLSNLCEPIGQNLCEDLKANVEEANRPVLLNFLSLGTFRQQNDSAEIEAKERQWTLMKLVK